MQPLRPPGIAGDVWLTAYDTKLTAKLPQRTLGIGLTAALFAELALQDAISVDANGRVRVLWENTLAKPLEEAVLSAILSKLRQEEQQWLQMPMAQQRSLTHNLSTCLNYFTLNGWADARVADRLVKSGHAVLRTSRNRRARKVSRIVPIDTAVSGMPASGLMTKLNAPRPPLGTPAAKDRRVLSDADLMFAGVLLATGLHQQALSTLTGAGRAELDRQLGNLSTRNRPQEQTRTVTLRSLVVLTVAIVGNAQMAGRA
jgi:hypothetical protein